MSKALYAILVVWKDGEQEYLKEGNVLVKFSSKSRASEQVEFMRMGMEDEVQSINIVSAP